MGLQETAGEFDSPQRLRRIIELICQLPGTYEVLINNDDGEEGILHCEKESIKNAAFRDLSGIDALSIILSWQRGKYWLEVLPILPTATIHSSLEELFAEIDKRLNHAYQSNEAEISPVPQSEPEDLAESVSTSDAQEGEEEHTPDPSSIFEPVVAPSEAPASLEQESPKEPVAFESSEPVADEAPFEVVSEQDKDTQSSANTASATETPPPTASADDLPSKIARIKGVNGVLLVSQDGEFLSAINIEANDDRVQMVALLQEALEQIGDLFAKGEFVHGAVDMEAERILIHPFQKLVLATFIGDKVSAAMLGSEIETLIAKEQGK